MKMEFGIDSLLLCWMEGRNDCRVLLPYVYVTVLQGVWTEGTEELERIIVILDEHKLENSALWADDSLYWASIMC